jgi:hypothetical protein
MRIQTILTALVAMTGLARADDQVNYATQIKPIFQARCYACHGALKQKGGLRLDTAASAIRGGQEPAITPGDVEERPVLERVSCI